MPLYLKKTYWIHHDTFVTPYLIENGEDKEVFLWLEKI